MKKYIHPHYFRLIIDRIRNSYTQYYSRFLARWWGVKIGHGSKFNGVPIFRVLPGTSIKIGNNATFNSSHSSNLIGVYTPSMLSTITRLGHIQIGDNCGFSGTVIASALCITIGNNVRCGANTLITDTDWHTDDYRTGKDKSVTIEDNVWLGYGVKVLKGVTIGKNSLIGAGSIVTHDIPANVVAAGNPCKIIKQLKTH